MNVYLPTYVTLIYILIQLLYVGILTYKVTLMIRVKDKSKENIFFLGLSILFFILRVVYSFTSFDFYDEANPNEINYPVNDVYNYSQFYLILAFVFLGYIKIDNKKQ